MDNTRRRDCSAIAEALLTGSTVMEVSLRTALGRYAGWSEEKVGPLQDRLDALNQVASSRWEGDDYWSCGFLAKLQQDATRLGRRGEVGAAEQAIKDSGKSVGELSQQWREQVKTWGSKNAETK